MEDKKKIIIHGVDVSGCQFRDNPYFSPCGGCENDDNCYYKQLKRKTEECEELQYQIDKVKNYVKSNMFDVDCVNWFERFIYTFEDWKKSIVKNEDKYKKTLEEIEQFCMELSDYDLVEETVKLILEIINKNKVNGGK